jgi:hypothetical protein
MMNHMVVMIAFLFCCLFDLMCMLFCEWWPLQTIYLRMYLLSVTWAVDIEEDEAYCGNNEIDALLQVQQTWKTTSRQRSARMAMQESDEHAEILEQGDIFLLYRPAVDNAEIGRLKGIQRFHLLLRPMHWRDHRLITIGKRSQSAPAQRNHHYWGFVEGIIRTDRQLEELFTAVQEGGLVVHHLLHSMWTIGMGEYQLVRHGECTKLAYDLALVEQASALQKIYQIPCSAQFMLYVKNPLISPPRSKAVEEIQLPQQLQAAFHGHRYLNTASPEHFNYAGMEFLLVDAEDEAIPCLAEQAEKFAQEADQIAHALYGTSCVQFMAHSALVRKDCLASE